MDDKFVGKPDEVLKQMRMAVDSKGPTFATLQHKESSINDVTTFGGRGYQEFCDDSTIA